MSDLKAMLAILAFYMPMVTGLLVGLYRYRRKKKAVKEEMERQYREGQEKGSVSSLYYKHPERRLFKNTFGIPIILGMFGSFLVLAIINAVFSK